jgi:pimeloyl-ACP methyl ester carboxylesterase
LEEQVTELSETTSAGARDGTGHSELEPGHGEHKWLLDYLVRAAGRVVNFEEDARWYPAEAKSAAMVPHVYYRAGERWEEIARGADAAGSNVTAVHMYFQACQNYRRAQHGVHQDDDPEQAFFYERLHDCYDRIIALSPYPIERVDLEWEGHTLSGLFHTLPGRQPAPTVVALPGLDNVKEGFPDPSNNPFLARNMNCFTFDGPGQGVANLRKVRLEARNFERAAVAFIDWLVRRPEVDPDRIMLLGTSLGSHYGMRVAAIDDRVKALGATAGGFNSMARMVRTGSPAYREIFAYNTGIRDMAELLRLADELHVRDAAPLVTCPVLMVVGEYDPGSPLRETYELFQTLPGPKELWVVEGESHDTVKPMPNFGGVGSQPFVVDWLRQAIDGRITADHDRALFVRRSGRGPYGDDNRAFWYPERAGRR